MIRAFVSSDSLVIVWDCHQSCGNMFGNVVSKATIPPVFFASARLAAVLQGSLGGWFGRYCAIRQELGIGTSGVRQGMAMMQTWLATVVVRKRFGVSGPTPADVCNVFFRKRAATPPKSTPPQMSTHQPAQPSSVKGNMPY